MDSTNTAARQLSRGFTLDVRGRNEAEATATIEPIEVSTEFASGSVKWTNGDFHSAHHLEVCCDETVWGQCLNLVFSAVAPQRIPPLSIFDADEWSKVALTLPDLLGEEGDIVRLEVTSSDWRAKLFVTSQPELTSESLIPLELRLLDAATTVIEMMARMFLGRSWLTGEIVPE
jgi:hypothetical protein